MIVDADLAREAVQRDPGDVRFGFASSLGNVNVAFELRDLFPIFDDFVADEIPAVILQADGFAGRQSVEVGIVVQPKVIRIHEEGFGEGDAV
jgi:hypothetical protein